MATEVLRVKKTKNFTVMFNHHLKNKELSLRSKGLLSVILSLPDNWNFTIKGLAAISKEGGDAIRSSIRELEEAGYVKRRRLISRSGKLSKTEYTFYEVARQKECDAENNVEEKPMSVTPISDNPILEKPMLEKPMLENPMLENPMLDKSTQLNTKYIKY